MRGRMIAKTSLSSEFIRQSIGNRQCGGWELGCYMLEASVEFDAAHYLRGYEGKCKNMHGHRWRVSMLIEGRSVKSNGIVTDFNEMKEILNESVMSFDHACINEIAPFDNISPTSENIAFELYKRIEGILRERDAGIDLIEVSVSESPDTKAAYRGKEAK